MFAALHGDLVPHAWRDPGSEHDAYQLFHQRSLAMSWLDGTGTDDTGTGAPGLWAMNDAGWDHPLAAPGTELVSWFQVEAGAMPGDRPLPVRPFLRCAEDTTARVGTLRLSAVQILMPVDGLDASSRPPYAIVPSMHTADWFAERDPRARTPVEVGVSSGRDPSLPAAAKHLADNLGRLDQDVFVCESYDVTGRGGTDAPPPPRRSTTASGTARLCRAWCCAENSPSGRATRSAGWLAEVVADSAARLGVRTPLLLTVRPAPSTG
ncbi:hypothetical protein [Streptomyces sp. SID12501]|uniref:hypothetical protein n=1 Tax=Streptomyces sp. SID12501 TaxID=2706042 RepID=UPI001EF2A634|nr:hypothetical protein [Streptomyces sp. SID12501]